MTRCSALRSTSPPHFQPPSGGQSGSRRSNHLADRPVNAAAQTRPITTRTADRHDQSRLLPLHSAHPQTSAEVGGSSPLRPTTIRRRFHNANRRRLGTQHKSGGAFAKPFPCLGRYFV